MTAKERAFVARVRRRAARLEPDIARAFLRGIDELRASLNVADMARLIDSGQIEVLLDRYVSDPQVRASFTDLQRQMLESVKTATETMAREIPPAFVAAARGISFNYLNPRVIDAVNRLDTHAMQTLAEGLRESVRDQIRAGVEAGVNPRSVARTLRQTVGLAPNQAKAVANFRAQLVAGSRAALQRKLAKGVLTTPSGKVIANRAHALGQGLSGRDLAMLQTKLGREPLTREAIDRMVADYQKRLLAWNAETNARSLALQSEKLGQRLSYEDMIAKGIVDRERLMRRRVEVLDERTRPLHALSYEQGGLNGEVRRFDEPYSNGEMVAGESEWNCRGQDFYYIAREKRGAA